jgi:glucose/arabinose dehydrogenase
VSRRILVGAAPAALVAALVAALALGPGLSGAGPTPRGNGTGVVKELVAEGLAAPIYSAAAPGVAEYVYVVERSGKVQAVDPADGAATEFLDITGRVSTEGEGGFLSIAFDPDYQANGLVYAYYTRDSSHEIVIEEFTALSDTDADETSGRRVLVIPHPGAENHQGGTIAFGPDDRLYAAPGDGGNAGDPDESAQDRGELTGKVLRIDPHGAGNGDYSVPAGNPFVDKPGRDEVYALGLRNPFRFAFDEPTGRIAIADVGQSRWEEVNLESQETLRRANFGWDYFEGDHRHDSAGDNEAPRPRRHYERPVHEYPHDQGSTVITGGHIVRDPSLPKLEGRYLYSDYSDGKLRSFEPKLSGAKGDRKLGVTVERPTSFMPGPDQTVYITSITTGKLFRLIPEP